MKHTPKKKLKGMTLMEIVISMMAYGMIALVVVQGMILVNSTIKATNDLNKRLAYEAKYADNFIITDGTNFDSKTFETNINYGDSRDANGKVVSVNSLDAHLGGSNVFLGTMYTAHYTDEENVTDKDGTNYRFMKFTKTRLSTSSVYKPLFPVTLELSADVLSSGIEKIVIYDSDKAHKDTATTQTILKDDLAADIEFHADNSDAQTSTDTIGTHTIYVEIYKKMHPTDTTLVEVAFWTELNYCTFVTSATYGERRYVQETSYSLVYNTSTNKYSVVPNGGTT